MQHLLNLLSAIALLIWGAHIVRAGILRVFGENLRAVLARSVRNRYVAVGAGVAVTGLVQSSTATCLVVSSFVGQGLIATAPALAVMLGADVGTSLMVVVYSFDLSWLSPVLILGGVVLFVSRESTTAGRLGRVAIGLGLITLALQLIDSATRPLTGSPAVQALIAMLPNEPLLDITAGLLLTLLSYSGLATVLLIASLAGSHMLPVPLALGLVLGANLGSGVLGCLSTARASALARRVPLGNLLFKLLACLAMVPALPYVKEWLARPGLTEQAQVVAFHLLFNLGLAALFLGLTPLMARLVDKWLAVPDAPNTGRPNHLDPVALATPSLAISCAAREALHQADVVETMLRGMLSVIRYNDRALSERLRKMDDTVDDLYSSIKFYLMQISRAALSESESRRWAEVVSFTINMEQIGDIIERVLQDVEDKNIHRNRSFSDAGMAEVSHMHERLLANLRLAMSV
ncbi:MAG: Na/Pi cotransporter family protein, partial [Burkholderiaceae bacterium]|nr:Na/Pi cotransporter family protein [Burkholderiaceae bacterium]